MKKFVIGITLMISFSSNASKTFLNPKIDVGGDLIKITCDSDLNLVCSQIAPDHHYAKDVKCLEEEYGDLKIVGDIMTDYVKTVGDDIRGMFNPKSQAQVFYMQGEIRKFAHISDVGVEAQNKHIIHPWEVASWERTSNVEYIREITCE